MAARLLQRRGKSLGGFGLRDLIGSAAGLADGSNSALPFGAWGFGAALLCGCWRVYRVGAPRRSCGG